MTAPRLIPVACALLATLGALPAGADDQLLGLCSTIEEARCTTSTKWTVQKTTSTPHLVNANNAPVNFTITVTEGVTDTAIHVKGVLQITGLIPGGTKVPAI